LAQRVLAEEHLLYPRVARWFLEGRLHLEAGCSKLDDETPFEAALHVPAAD
jgi:phosphoribosylglycinamide formyltransferase-1